MSSSKRPDAAAGFTRRTGDSRVTWSVAVDGWDEVMNGPVRLTCEAIVTSTSTSKGPHATGDKWVEFKSMLILFCLFTVKYLTK